MIAIKARKLNQWEAVIGLIGKNNPESIFFHTRFGIHTFGLNFPIDIVILNFQYNVVIKKENLQPNKVFLWHPKFNNILELPSGTILMKKIKIGKKLKIYWPGVNGI